MIEKHVFGNEVAAVLIFLGFEYPNTSVGAIDLWFEEFGLSNRKTILRYF
jgi:hypothetical protein